VPVTLTVLAPLLTVDSIPSGLQIYVDGLPYNTPHSFSWPPNSTHTVDASNPVNSNLVQASFGNWTDQGAIVHQVQAPSQPTRLVANFNASYFLFLLPSGPGSITVNGNGGEGYYPFDRDLHIDAVPQTGAFFQGFGGDLSGTHTPQSLRMTG